ncbi:hypothetical protein LINPERPRIM_LOCUS26481 [Linum perenne]
MFCVPPIYGQLNQTCEDYNNYASDIQEEGDATITRGVSYHFIRQFLQENNVNVGMMASSKLNASQYFLKQPKEYKG